VRYVGADQSIQLRWSGDPSAAYTIQYEVGEGAYHLEGELAVTGNKPTYGPYHESFWNPLVLYNPWRFRVYPAGAPEQASDWVTFSLAPSGSGAGAWSISAVAMGAAAGLKTATGEGAALVTGLGIGLLDLCAWVATIPAADLTAWALMAAIAAAVAWPRLARVGIERCRAWGVAIAYIAFVYATVPVLPVVWDRLRDHTEGAIDHLGIVVIAGLALAIVERARRTAVRPGSRAAWQPCVVLTAVFAAYGYPLVRFSTFPAERLHLVEYGLVSLFLLRALRLDLSSRGAYLASLMLTAVVGFGDECIQWALPQRFFELKDVQLNFISGALGLVTARFALYGPQAGPPDTQSPS
jgi:VanZ family protein